MFIMWNLEESKGSPQPPESLDTPMPDDAPPLNIPILGAPLADPDGDI